MLDPNVLNDQTSTGSYPVVYLSENTDFGITDHITFSKPSQISFSTTGPFSSGQVSFTNSHVSLDEYIAEAAVSSFFKGTCLEKVVEILKDYNKEALSYNINTKDVLEAFVRYSAKEREFLPLQKSNFEKIDPTRQAVWVFVWLLLLFEIDFHIIQDQDFIVNVDGIEYDFYDKGVFDAVEKFNKIYESNYTAPTF